MTTILSFLPVIILIAIIVSIIFLNKRLQKSPLTFKKSKWIVIGYIMLLAITAAIAPLLPTSEAKVLKDDSEQDWMNSLYQRAYNGDFYSIEEENISRKWEFPYTEDVLNLDAIGYEESILIEKTDQLNGNIEVYFIEDWHVMYVNSVSLDVSDYTPTVNVEVGENGLHFMGYTGETDVSLAYAEPEFTLRQFLDAKERGFSSSVSRFFYVRIPANIQVEYDPYLIVDMIEN